jgi:hypothetical protein
LAKIPGALVSTDPGATSTYPVLSRSTVPESNDVFGVSPMKAARDEPTADFLMQRMQVHEKTAWTLRSMLA